MMKQMELEKNLLIHSKIDNLESMKFSEFVFDYVYLLYYKFHEINLNRDG